MTFKLPELPYSLNALAPHISQETLEFHHGKHHQTYVTNLNNLVENTDKSLEDLIKLSPPGPIFNNAAQVWNHSFYWHSLSPNAGGAPKDKIGQEIQSAFGSFENFKEQFNKAALGQFGSGWAWLVCDSSGKLAIVTSSNAGCPLQDNRKPILTCDVWEHAYYIDYRNARAKYLDAWWQLVNWSFANENL